MLCGCKASPYLYDTYPGCADDRRIEEAMLLLQRRKNGTTGKNSTAQHTSSSINRYLRWSKSTISEPVAVYTSPKQPRLTELE